MTHRVLCISDAHGCLNELNALLAQLNLTDQDRLVFVGDLIDKGPDSAGVVQRVRLLSTRMRVDLVLGNHEETHIRWMGKADDKKHEMKRHAEYVEIHKNLNDEDRDFMRNARLFVKVPGGVVVHAGIPGFLHALPDLGTFESMPRRSKDLAKQMCRLRYVDKDGHFVGLYETDKDLHTYWADGYDGRFGTVIYGHQAFLSSKPNVSAHAIGIDLGCVYGGYLCALELNPENLMDSKVYLEQGRSKYAAVYGEE